MTLRALIRPLVRSPVRLITERRGGVTIISPITLPVAPAAFFGTTRLSTYSATGPVFDVFRPSDSTTTTINFANNKPDAVALATFLGSQTGQITAVYDQSGNGLNTPTAASNRPKVRVDITTGGIPAVIFDGSNGAPLITAQLDLPAGLALNIQSLTMMFAGRQSISQNTSCLASLTISGATAAKWQVLQGPSYVATSTQTTPTYPPTNPIVLAVSVNATNTKHFIGERVFSRTATTGTGTSAGGIWGNDIAGVSRGMNETCALVFWSTTLADADVQTARASFEAALTIQTTFTETIALTGDSILQGTGTTLCQNLTRQLWPLLKRPTRMINSGVFGATMASLTTGVGLHTPFAGWTQSTRVWVLQSGTNDIAAGTTASALAAIASARITDAKSAGENKVGICTILPRQTWIGTPALWTEAQAYNDLVRANYVSWGADFLVDLAADPTMGNITNTSNTALYTDGLHPSTVGNAILAAIYAAGINANI